VPPLVTFTSDFGLTDWFVGVVHGAVHAICPAAHVVDLTHAIPPGDVTCAAFVLEAAAADFPPGTVHLAVVDPGVGTSRLALGVAAHGQHFVGPDNGVLEWALGAAGARVHALDNERWFRQPVSHTFHGRDVFAPVAAHLAQGVALASFGPAVENPVRLRLPAPRAEGGALRGRIAYRDRFGNALTNLTASAIAATFPGVPEPELVVEVLDRTITGIQRSYGDVPIGALVALLGSSGRLEIAEAHGDATKRFGLGIGDVVRVRAR